MGGGNNRLFCVTAGQRQYALKEYPQRAERRPRSAWQRSSERYSFSRQCGVGDVPRPIAADRAKGFALYEWIDGTAGRRSYGRRMSTQPSRSSRACTNAVMRPGLPLCLRLAKPACRRWTYCDASRPAVRSLERSCSSGTASWPTFLSRIMRLAQKRSRPGRGVDIRASGWTFDRPIDPNERSLSPSDFGFHNAIRRADGRLAFVDFEYFGWDDPAKLVADFL